MHTSVPNFNFLARLVSEIWRGSQNKKWQLLIFPDPLSDKFLHEAIVPANAYQRTKFQLPSSNSFQDKEGVPKFNVGLQPPPPPAVPRTLKLLSVLQVLGKINSLPNFSIVSLCIMQLCEYVFPIGFPLYVPKMIFWGFWGWRCKNTVFWPQKGTTLREYASVGISRVKIGLTAWAVA